jgi:hypothetical protein
MVLPILEAKYDLGLFEHPYADESKVDNLSRPEGLALERKLAAGLWFCFAMKIARFPCRRVKESRSHWPVG